MSRQNLLRVVHVAQDMARVSGGVPAVVCQLAERLNQNHVMAQIAHVTGNPGKLPSGIDIYSFPSVGLGHSWSWGGGLRAGLSQLANPFNADCPLFHIHGAWAAPQYFAARTAYKAGVPFVFTSHGMLEPWLWNQQGWRVNIKKRLYWATLARAAFSRASVIQAITSLEKRHLADLFPGKNIEVIPNAIDVDDVDDLKRVQRSKSILFLGRIEPKKGVDILLNAFSLAKLSKDWSVNVVGPVWSDSYMTYLQSIINKNGLADRVCFHGPLFGEEKFKLIDKAWVLAAPSHSEVIGLVNLEASARRLPTITTHETGLYDWEQGGGLLIFPTVNSLRHSLEVACSWSDQEQHERGVASRGLVLKRYSWQAVMPMWLNLYNSLI